MYVGNLLEFKGTFKCYWIRVATTEVKKVVGLGECPGEVLHAVV